MNAEAFRTELEALINRHSMECGSDTPDTILAKFLLKCLFAFDEAVVSREAVVSTDRWYGKRVTEIVGVNPTPEPVMGGGGGGAGASAAVQAVGFVSCGQPLGYAGGAGGAGGNSSGGSSARKLEPGDVAAAKGALDTLNVLKAGDLRSLSDDEERDWRTFAFAKTQEGSVWERASVQRLFATIDALRAARTECERQLQESLDKYGAALEDVNSLREDRDAASKKWQEYERDYILPCFRWARELGIDLERMVLDSPGHNCVELLVSTLRERAKVATEFSARRVCAEWPRRSE